MLLIITGTISPGKQNNIVLVDEKIRLQEYVYSIQFYLQSKSMDGIIFCENSGYFAEENLKNNLEAEEILKSLSELAMRNSVELEVLSFLGNQGKVREKGKGYGEGEILEYIFRNSKLIKQSEVFIKVTGRLNVINISDIAIRIEHIMQKRKNIAFFNIPNPTRRDIYDTRIYAISKDMFQQYFMKAYENVNDNKNKFLEHVYTDVLVELEKKNVLKVMNFPRYPRITGTSGSTGNEYVYIEWKSKLKDILSKLNYYKVNNERMYDLY